jgi:hypothetical protein
MVLMLCGVLEVGPSQYADNIHYAGSIRPLVTLGVTFLRAKETFKNGSRGKYNP